MYAPSENPDRAWARRLLAGGQARAAEKPRWMSPLLPDGTREEAVLEALPGKQKLIRLADRPPNYEAPIDDFRTAITPNDQFFVRYHLAGIPSMADLGNWSLNVGGDAAERQITLSLDDLQKNFAQVEVAAVCQCSGNRRGLSSAARGWRGMGLRRDGQRGVARASAEGRAGQGRGEGGRCGSVAGRRRWPGAADDAGLPQEPADGQGDG